MPTGVTIALAVGLLLIFGITAVIRKQRQESAQFRQLMMELGFSEMGDPDDPLRESVERLFPERKRLSFRKKFRSEMSDVTWYVTEFEKGRQDSEYHSGLLLVSRYLQLPRFVLYPRIEQTGLLASLGNRLIESAAKRKLQRVEIEARPDFNKSYFLFCDNPDEVRRFFSGGLVDRICACPRRYNINGKGDAFLTSRMDFSIKRLKQKWSDRMAWREYLDDVERFYQELKQDQSTFTSA